MDIAKVLTDILVVLVAAKVAAEVAERVGVPAVVGEIIAGIVVGPSALGLVGHSDDVLRTLGEIGVILLLLEVGMEMDLGELGKVGRASLLVATVGVIVPMVLGLGAMELIGENFKTSLFVGAALAATSVGITARVFGDLRALATTEARVVLGAAVADDVMSLVVLTVVVRLVTQGSVSVLSVLGIVAVAVAFLGVGVGAGLRLSGPLFAAVDRFSRSTGTLVAMALAFTLAFARTADAAKLAPIVGAFVAGVALTRSDQSGRIRRELAPVGHLFIPVFFLQIGIDADIGAFAHGAVLRDAALLLLVAVAGKLVSPLGAIGTPGDKLLIGLAMLPRGEVGLIFATIGLSNGVLDGDLYASLLLVVLVTTVATPQLLKARYRQVRAAADPAALAADLEPPGGWLRVSDGVVDLAARPPASAVVHVALTAAVLVARDDPGPELGSWLADVAPTSATMDAGALEALLDVVERGNARSWRFLDTTGVLPAVLPLVAEGFHRRGDPFAVDPLNAYRLAAVDRLRRLDADDGIAIEASRLLHPSQLVLAALLVEALDGMADPVAAAATTLEQLPVDGATRAAVTGLVEDRDLLWAAALRAGGLQEPVVLQLASHLDTPERVRALFVVSALTGGDRERWQLARLRQLHDLIQETLAHDDLSSVEARDLVGIRRDEGIQLLEAAGAGRAVVRRVAESPRAYVVRAPAETIARHATMLDESIGRGEARVKVLAADTDGRWIVDVVARDRPGLLASVTGVLVSCELDVVDALVATWRDGSALESFVVEAVEAPDAGVLRSRVAAAFDAPLSTVAVPEAVVTFDADASPWHTACEISAPDRPGLLHVVASAFCAGGAEVVSAVIAATDGVADGRFELTDARGHKLGDVEQDAVRAFLQQGVTTRRRWFRRRYEPAQSLAPRGAPLDP